MNENEPIGKRSLFRIIACVLTYPIPIRVLVIVVVVLLFLGWSHLRRGFINHDHGHPLNGIANNLRILEGAKEQWVLEHHQTNGALPTPADLAQYLKNREFIKPAGGEIYTINPVGERITAKLTRKLYDYDAGQLLTVTNF